MGERKRKRCNDSGRTAEIVFNLGKAFSWPPPRAFALLKYYKCHSATRTQWTEKVAIKMRVGTPPSFPIERGVNRGENQYRI